MNLPNDFLKRMKFMLEDEFDEFIDTFNSDEHYVGIRINTKKDLTNTLEKITNNLEKVKWCNNGYYCTKEIISGNHPYHIAGLIYFQEPSAMSCVEMLDIKPDDFVLDLCAAPGGKSTQAGVKLSDDGLLIANEIIPKRASILAENIERFGINNAIVTNENPQKLSEKFECFFDKIIVDAPCSGEGMFKKEPRAVEEWSISHTQTCAVRQKHIMDCAYKMLKPGGYIAYSTCTFAPDENEGVIDYMLSTYNDLSLEETNLDMISNGDGKWVDSEYDLRFTKRIFPHKNKGEGHFLALLKKEGETRKSYVVENKSSNLSKNDIKLYREFEKEYLNVSIKEPFVLFGENLYKVPHNINLDKLKVTRAGVHLGTFKKNRFEPSHALLMSLKYNDFKNVVNFSCDSEKLYDYLKGNVIASELKGYTAICVDEYPIGWAKGSGGILKNHFPKHLRIN